MISTRNILKLILIEWQNKGKLFGLIIAACFGFLFLYFFSTGSSLSNLVQVFTDFSFGDGDSLITNSDQKFHLLWFPKIQLLCLTIITSMAFSEYSQDQSAQFFMSIPANKLEKWISKVLVYLIIAPIVITLLYQAFTLFSYKWDSSQIKLKLNDPYIWKYYKAVLLFQCIIFFTSVFFRKNTLYKSILLLVLLVLATNTLQLVSMTIFREDIQLINAHTIPVIQSLDVLLEDSEYRISPDAHISVFSLTELYERYIGFIWVVVLGLSYLKYSELES